jgi:hypothetical protein
LFSQRGNCSIHFYGKGQSRRGPSLRIPLERIYSARFASLFTLFHTELAKNGLIDDDQPDELHRQCDLYIPAPEDSLRKEAFTWHMTTRNFFAFILGRPVVGIILGQALIDLRERLDLFRPNDPRNHPDFMAYLDKLGYLDFAHCADYAIALLNFAEHFKLRELWVDAFVHCVGMNAALSATLDFNNVSRVTNGLITRAYVEMDLHLGRITRALSNFLEEDFSPSHFGVSTGARTHLDRFRTFLHGYYVEKLGYWPPPKRTRFSKSLYKSMYFDFRGLYDYLVDLDSTDSLAHQKPAAGGICVLQNVKAFDDRHKFIALPHPHPLLPHEAPSFERSAAPQGSRMRAMMLGYKPDPVADMAWTRNALAAATNCTDPVITSAPLVKAYQRFERDYMRRSEDKVSVHDARKVRWLLIYGTLQMLISVIRAPKEVRMTETTYPLCCLVTGTSPWEAGLKALTSSHTASVLPVASPPTYLDIVSAVSIHPDCETDNYISSIASSTAASPVPCSNSRRLSAISFRSDATSPPPPSRAGLLRNASIRSVKTLSSSIGSISSYRSSSKRRSIGSTPGDPPAPSSHMSYTTTTVAKPSNFCEIVVHGYGNGLYESSFEIIPRILPAELSADNLPEIVVSPQSPPRSPLWKESRSDGLPNARPRSSRMDEKPQDLVFQMYNTANGGIPKSHVPEPSRTPLMDGFDRALPGLGELSNSPSTQSSSSGSNGGTPLIPLWSSSRSNSPHSSASSQSATESTTADPKPSHYKETSPISPTSPTLTDRSFSIPTPASPVHTVLPGLLSPKKSLDLPMVVAIEEMRVYQPTGIPSVNGNNGQDAALTTTANFDDEEEFPDREGSKRWSVASRSIVSVPVPLKSSLRRTRTAATNVAMKRRSVRIKEEPTGMDWVARFRGSAVASH